MRTTALVLTSSGLLAGLMVAPAHAHGGLVYNAPHNGHENIYVAHADGSHKKLVKKGCYIWTSMDDHGKIWAENCNGTKIYRMN